jgi:outer membrane immunogenic protein
MMKTIISGGVALSLLTVSAFGADLAVPPSFSAPPSPPPFTWTSCYGGLHAGGGWGQKDLTDSAGILTIGTPGATANLGISGYMLGGQFGCDYQFASNWVLGIEGAASGGDIGGTINSTNISTGGGDSTTFHETTDFLGSVTGRVGFAWDRWLVYGKGGIAWAGDRYSALDAFQLYNYNGVETRSGWTAGAGVEWALWKDWSVKLEYDYYGFGQGNVNFIDSTIGAPPGLENIKQTVQVVQLGVNFHFFAGP